MKVYFLIFLACVSLFRISSGEVEEDETDETFETETQLSVPENLSHLAEGDNCSFEPASEKEWKNSKGVLCRISWRNHLCKTGKGRTIGHRSIGASMNIPVHPNTPHYIKNFL
ncbi:hypothetical protein Avbf_10705 [Armadillidium vulgare]|nr:hypothetical protein Avbf_10705 [Armadillidium vulgare]